MVGQWEEGGKGPENSAGEVFPPESRIRPGFSQMLSASLQEKFAFFKVRKSSKDVLGITALG